jgi:EF-P beta-lysylation protein EpmB
LLILTGACAVHCRYCFRRHFPYNQQQLNAESKNDLFKLLQEEQKIDEVIFSGGDPLLLSNSQLKSWSEALANLPQIKRWRLHTRLPSVLPSRINPDLIGILKKFQDHARQVVVVTHINHAQELNAEVQAVLRGMDSAGITLLNQAVLLKGINDDVRSLKALSEKLFASGVLPYYLHLLDRTPGALHFEVPELEAVSLYRDLSSVLPGYLVPKLVREVEGQPHKLIVGHH